MRSDWKNEPIVVLDACALIAFFNDEPGAEVVEAIFGNGPPSGNCRLQRPRNRLRRSAQVREIIFSA
jgi:hypothetical protein